MFDQHRRWKRKFADAFRGIREGVRGQNSFAVHVPAAIIALGLGLWLLDLTRFAILVLCVANVITCELINSAIEWLARAVTQKHDERIRNALDIGSGAVLFSSLAACASGGLLLAEALARRFGLL